MALAAAAVLVAAGAVLVAGGGDEERQPAETRAEQPRTVTERQTVTETTPAPTPTPTPAASGSDLNAQGFELMQAGRYAEAVPILERAVAAWPEDSQDIEYAYALYNLGASLSRSGNPEAAIPYLEKRLAWNDQRKTVEKELKEARKQARKA